MGLHIDNLYSEFDTTKDLIFSEEAYEKYAEFSKQWLRLTMDLPVEEKMRYIYLRASLDNFMNICCKDHFTKGFETGVNVAYKLTDKYIGPLYDSLEEDEIDGNTT